MNPRLSSGSLRAFRRDGQLVIEIDEHRFCADAFAHSESRILDRDAFLAFACENLFSVLHDASTDERTWWTSFCQAVGQGAADAGAGVRLDDGGEDRLPVDQPPDLFPDEIARELLGAHVKPVALSARSRAVSCPLRSAARFPAPADLSRGSRGAGDRA